LGQAKKELADMEQKKARYKPNSNKAKRLAPEIEKKQQKISYEESQLKKK
jgi:hypothetical protein